MTKRQKEKLARLVRLLKAGGIDGLTRADRDEGRDLLATLLNEADGADLTSSQRGNMKTMLGMLEDFDGQPTRRNAGGTDYLGMILNGRGQAAGECSVFAHLVRAFAAGGGDQRSAADFASSNDMPDIVTRTLTSGSAEGGGVFVPAQIAGDFIDLLRPRSVVRAASPNIVGNIDGTLEFPKLTSGVTSQWVGEAKKISTQQPKTGAIRLTPKKLAVQVPVSMDLLRGSAGSIENIIRNDMVRSAATVEDVAFLEGLGTVNSPKGLLNWAAAGNKFDANAVVDVTNVTADLRTAKSKLSNADAPAKRRWWFMREEVALYLELLRDSGQLVFPTVSEGMLLGSPIGLTNNIPANLGVGEDETRVYYAALDDIYLGEVNGLIVRASDAAQYVDPTDGVTKDAFSHHVLVLQIILIVDLIVGHAESVSVVEAVTWHNA